VKTASVASVRWSKSYGMKPGTTLDGVCVIDVASTSAKLLGLLPEVAWLRKTAFNSGKRFQGSANSAK